jgi:iodotyrosine deiodinase
MSTKMINGFPFVTYTKETYGEEETIQRSADFLQWMDTRRTVRDFLDKPVPKEVIENLIMAASTAPSGAHKQPWTFCAVSNAEIKRQIREAAEAEEYESYNKRMPPEWLEDLLPLQTDWHKEFLTTAPWIIVVFKRIYEPGDNSKKKNNYYVQESVGLATGFLLTAIHNAGLVALTHTPSPMNFLTKLLNRPEYEKPFLLIPVGYPADECLVPQLARKPIEEVAAFYE